MQSVRKLAIVLPRNIAIRSLASASPASDPIQKLFVDKIREYASKSKNAPNGLVDSSPDLLKKLSADMDRVANSFGIKDEKNIADLGLKFEDTAPLDPINLK